MMHVEVEPRPVAPSTIEETGLDQDLVVDLVRKALHCASELAAIEVAKRLGFAFSVIQSCLDSLRAQRQCEIIGGGSGVGGQSFRYRLTDLGHARAVASLDRSHYTGIAPVPIVQYRRYMEEFDRFVTDAVTPADVRRAFVDLVISDKVLDELGPAVSAGHSIFIYGPPGNGKTAMATGIRRLLAGSIWIPHALEVSGSIIRFFDPAVHEPLRQTAVDEHGGVKHDQRWVRCRRPMVTVGGELTLEALALAYNSRSGTYRAPVQALANGGVLVIDDFGRQKCSPRDLLNWWMVPLESRVEYLTLNSGERLEMPFQALLIFSTNIRPADLVDEAFLRRIQYKIYAEGPTPEAFTTIFERCCRDQGVRFEATLVQDLLDGFFKPRRIGLRACQPRDLINQALAIARYNGEPGRLTAELLRSACLSYFIDERESPRDSP